MTRLSLHALFSDHAVLQRGTPIPVWGSAEPGSLVTVTCAGASTAGTADHAGKFLVRLPALPAGGPHTLSASTAHDTVTISNVLIGDVFLCSGQSNMEWSLDLSAGGAEAIAVAAEDPAIRILMVPKRPSLMPRTDLDAAWRVAAPASAKGCSGVAWFAAKRLRRERPDIPIGLINCAWGGTPAEAWTSGRSLALLPEIWAGLRNIRELERLKQRDPAAAALQRDSLRRETSLRFDAWHDDLCAADGGEPAGLHRADADLSGWADFPVPGFWPNKLIGGHDGIVWFAIDFEVSAEDAGRDAVLHLGSVDNEDTTWINGEQVGRTDLMAGPFHWNLQRDYRVPGRLLRAGRNRLTVRVIDYGGRGGFGGGPQGVSFERAGALATLPAVWRFKVGAALQNQRPSWPSALNEAVDQNSPAALFNGMIAPLLPAALAGVWWYQGESNADRAAAYRRLFPAMIQDWRAWFQAGAAGDDGGALPFFWVQLTSFKAAPDSAGQASTWAALRESQTATLILPATGQAVIYDCGDAHDIHPTDKRTPGERLALLTLREEGRTVIANGPRVVGSEEIPEGLRLRWAATGGLRSRDGQPLRLFAIAGSDHRWHWADAQIDGDSVILRHSAVSQPVAARFAWADNPMAANLTDASGLPAWPTRTDDWAI
ncbi:9-O-acetylesterase [Planctomycetota bacterium]|nr:9-O-acetylesterase [Planctomycetota bacterium]